MQIAISILFRTQRFNYKKNIILEIKIKINRYHIIIFYNIDRSSNYKSITDL